MPPEENSKLNEMQVLQVEKMISTCEDSHKTEHNTVLTTLEVLKWRIDVLWTILKSRSNFSFDGSR